MQISRLSIENFRCIRSLDIRLSSRSVIIGENNAGKTAILDAVRIALGRRRGQWGQTGFTEFDFPLGHQQAGARPDIRITLWFSETRLDEWPQPLADDLADIIRSDPSTGVRSICLRVTCSFESVSKSVDPDWKFLREDNEPFAGAGARNQNLTRFFDYVPCFSMAAMRDANIEFGGRSRFWGSLLKTINVSEETTAELEARFAELNDQLLGADPKLEAIKVTLRSISAVIANGAVGDVDVRAVPVSLWEIISRAEVVVRGQTGDPWLPLGKHGHGVQSLAIIFLFRAFVENALAASLHEETEPVLTLEEPEAHLHPQACRSLWDSISTLPGQKLITTHSPFFVQNVPFKDIIILRRGAKGPRATSISREFFASVTFNPELAKVIQHAQGSLRWDPTASALACTKTIGEDQYRDLLRCYTDSGRQVNHAALRALREESRRLIPEEEVARLESWAKRIRGEIFFGSKWLLCEGQAEYAVLGAIAEKLGCPLDAHGISVIDYQNNGSPGAFAALARALDYPWAMICDGDEGGDGHVAHLRSHHFTTDEVTALVTQLPRGTDLERAIVKSGLRPCFVSAVRDLDPSIADDDEALLTFAYAGRKEEIAVRVGSHIRRTATVADIPETFRQIFVKIGACK
jgi:putative ATP-dependent endonuclease of OLD family